MVDSFRVNTDFEYRLKGLTPPANLIDGLDFIYFFFPNPKGPLYTTRSFENDYLEYLASLGLDPQYTQSGSYENWWGSLDDIELSRTLNSQITSAKIANQFQLNPVPFFFPKDARELLGEKYEYLVKDEFSVSGSGVRKFTGKVDLTSKVLVKKLERVMDLGFSADLSEEEFTEFFTVNEISKSFSFKKGSLGVWNQLEKSFGKKLVDQYREAIKVLKSEYVHLGARRFVQFDSFIFKSRGTYFLQGISEVNCRRTMGQLIYHLANRYTPNGLRGKLEFIPNRTRQWKTFSQFKRSLGPQRFDLTVGGILPLSPVDRPLILIWRV